MPVPRLIREHLGAASGSDLPGQPSDSSCKGAQHHSPRPILLHEVALTDGRSVMLCGTCRDNLATLTHLLRSTSGQVPWGVRREFGNAIRALAGC